MRCLAVFEVMLGFFYSDFDFDFDSDSDDSYHYLLTYFLVTLFVGLPINDASILIHIFK